MKIFVYLIFMALSSWVSANNNYNGNLAQSLGADDYGMKTYVMALLKPGPNRDQDNETAQKLQQAHLANIRKMAESGQLVLAGPFMKNNQNLQGIYIFDVRTVEEARAMTDTDPAVKAGRLTMDLIPWYGSATLPMINEWHDKIAHKKF